VSEIPHRAVRIEITDFRENPNNDSAFAIYFDLKGPGNAYDSVVVYFTEYFFEAYFKIPWNRDLAEEEHRIVEKKRDLFVRWALMKVEQDLKANGRSEKITVDYEPDRIWAEKIEKGLLWPKSQAQGEHAFIYV